jgi:chromosome partitioning protein
MVPAFVRDWETGLNRFRETNPHFKDFDSFGKPVFAGWIFNGFDTTRERRSTAEVEQNAPVGKKKMLLADQTMHNHVADAINDKLVKVLAEQISKYYSPIAAEAKGNYRIGDIEDANVLIQNSLWLNVPLGNLDQHDSLRDRKKWAENQVEQIKLLKSKFAEVADNIIKICV